MNVKRTTLGFMGLSGCGKSRLLGTWPGDLPLVILDFENGCAQVLGDAAEYVKKSDWDACKTYEDFGTLFNKSGKKVVVVTHLVAWELLHWVHEICKVTSVSTSVEPQFAIAIDTLSSVVNAWFRTKVDKTPDVSRAKSGKFETPDGEVEIQPSISDYNHAKMYVETLSEAIQKCRTTVLLTFHEVPIVKKVSDGAGGTIEVLEGYQLDGPGRSVAEAVPKYLDGLIHLTRKGGDPPQADYTPTAMYKKLKIRTTGVLPNAKINNVTLEDIIKLQQ